MKKIAVTNGLMFTDHGFLKGSVLVHDDRIYDVIQGDWDDLDLTGYQVIDAAGCYVSCGFIDPHVHFRCPGQEYKEDWESGSRAAIKGGFTFVIDMPNNIPVADNSQAIREKNTLAAGTKINFGFHIGLTDANSGLIGGIYNELKSENIPVFGIKTFLGSSTGDLLVKNDTSISESLRTGSINLFHCEDELTLSSFKSVEYKSVLDHHKKRPPLAEVNALIRICKAADGIKDMSKIYICHVTSKDEVEEIKRLRREGFCIITEISPHHLFFHLENITDSDIYKVNPPIRPKIDAECLRNEFNEGFFDIIGTDHAPHLLSEKQSIASPSGMPGLETCFNALYDIHEKYGLSLEMIFKLMTSGYKIFGIKDRGELKKDFYADITIIKKQKNEFNATSSETKADFSPFDGMIFESMIDTVLINGNIVMEKGRINF